jgi:prefoldin subunit 2
MRFLCDCIVIFRFTKLLITMEDQQQIVRTFQQLRSERNEIAQKITELEMEKNEHKLVVRAISDLDPGRRCYRLIGGVLVERTVGEVLPAVQKNLEGIEQLLKTLHETLVNKDKALNDFKTQHKIRVMGEDQEDKEEKEEPRKSTSSGVLV